MRPKWRFAQWLIFVVLLSVTLTIVLPGHRRVTVAAGVMAVLGLVLVRLGGAAYRLAAARDPEWERVRHVATPKLERPADLERIELRLGWRRYSTGDFNYRVRPMLQRLAVHRLRESHAVDAEKSPDDARAFVSPELWDYVITKQPPGNERVIGTADIARMVDEIEGI